MDDEFVFARRKKMKKLICTLLSILIVVTTAPLTAFASEKSGGYLSAVAISDKYDFAEISNKPSGNYYLTDDIIFTANDFKYGGAFFNGGSYFSAADTFSGTLDGCGHTVSGLKGNSAVALENRGTVKNLCLNSCELTSGAICTYNNGEVYNCKLIDSLANGVVYTNNGNISYCFSKESNCGICITNSKNISYCINYSDTTIDIDDNWNTRAHIGGIACINSGTISCCGNYGNISGYDRAAGICSNSTTTDIVGTVERCFNYGNVYADTVSSGIACEDNNVYECINYGEITGRGAGILNNSFCDIVDCVNLGTVSHNGYGRNGQGYPISYGSCVDSYYLEGTGDEEESGIKLNAQEVQSADSFSQLNFDTTWGMTESGIKLKCEDVRIEGLMLYNLPDKLYYNEGEAFNPDGLLVMSYDNKGEWKLINDYTYDGFTGIKGINTITVTENGISAEFDVLVQQDINKSTLKQKYTSSVSNGKALTPNITVISPEGSLLTINKDYTVSYSNNVYPGKATITIRGINNYKGTATRYFIITPAQTTGLKVKTQKEKSLALIWNKQNGVSGYRVEKYNSKTKKYDLYKNTTANSLTVSKLITATQYKFRVRAYKIIDGKTYYGAYSNVLTAVTKLPDVKGIKVKLTGNSKHYITTVNWKKTKNVSGYQLMLGDDYNDSGKIEWHHKVKAKKNKTKYVNEEWFGNKPKGYSVNAVRIRTYKKIGGKVYYGKWSKVYRC